MMRRSTRKLAIRSETIRAIARMDLVLVAAGANTQLADTEGANKGCLLQAAATEPAKS
jgi:hypothetical protein